METIVGGAASNLKLKMEKQESMIKLGILTIAAILCKFLFSPVF